ncbi:MAG: type II CRISPR RNA-guided endonuclease Cas9, partial [Weeksellaceae bacterium]|nr:type II CRISPR RNA-guided endonuclease Cas9 [Weeksellaceae bacterium]
KDHFGNEILDDKGNKIPVDFVSTGNNHHVAVYRSPVLNKNGELVLEENGTPKYELQENVVSFFEAVERVNQGLPIIDKAYNQHLGWEFLFTMKQNEMFVFPNEETGFKPTEIDLLDPRNKKEISPNLFRVQTLSIVKYGNNTIRDFKFRHHLESTLTDIKELQGITFQQIKSLSPLQNIIKVRINHLGDIVGVGEY